MADLMKIDRAQVDAIADSISKLNDDLQTTLTNAQTTIKNLEQVWTGDAATATIEAVNSFANQYFQSYKDLIDQYVEFLKNVVVSGHEDTETTNTTLADAFK